MFGQGRLLCSSSISLASGSPSLTSLMTSFALAHTWRPVAARPTVGLSCFTPKTVTFTRIDIMSMDMIYDTSNQEGRSCEGMFNASNNNMICFLDYMVIELKKAVKYQKATIEEDKERRMHFGENDLSFEAWNAEQIKIGIATLHDLESTLTAFELLSEGHHASVYSVSVALPLLDIDIKYERYVNAILHESIKILMFQGNSDVWVA